MLRLLLLASLVGSASTSPEAPAGSEPTGLEPAAAEASVVDISFALVGEWELGAETLEPVLAASLVDLGIEVSVTRRARANVFVHLDWARRLAKERPGRAVFWLVRHDPETIQLFVLPPGTDLGYVRDIPFSEGTEELAESLAVIVRGAAESLRAGPPSGMRSLEPEPPPEPEPEPEIVQPVQPVRPPPSPHVRVGLAYLGGILASNARWQSGVALDVGIRFPVGFTAAITAGWMTGRARDELAGLGLHRVPLGVVAGYAFDPARRITGRLMGTGVAEVMWWMPSRRELHGGSDVRVGLGLRADLVVHLHRGLGLVLAGSAVGWLRNVRVDAETLGVMRTVLQPGPVGAEVRAGLQYEF